MGRTIVPALALAMLMSSCCGPSIAIEDGITSELTEFDGIVKQRVHGIVVTRKGSLYRNGEKLLERSRDSIIEVATSQDCAGLFVISRNGGEENLYSSDGGKTLEHCDKDSPKFERVMFHPKEKSVLIGTAQTKACDGEGTKSVNCFLELLLSKDGGKSWKVLTTHVVQAGWQERLSSAYSVRARSDKDYSILVTQIRSSERKATKDGQGFLPLQRWDSRLDMVEFVGKDFRESLLVLNGANRFVSVADLVFAAVHDATDSSNERVRLLSSKDGGKTWNQVYLPVDLGEYSYTLLDHSEGVVFLHASHLPRAEQPGYGNLYMSNSYGDMYVLSLEMQARSSDGTVDFAPIQGLEGVYISNVLNDQGLKETRISFDKGGKWEHVLAHGSADPLHLHGMTSMPELMSVESDADGLGMILANGNSGAALSHHEDEINLYLSRDGGKNFKLLLNGPHVSAIGNYGGLLVAAPSHRAVHDIDYSIDNGETWSSHRFTSNSPVYITSIEVAKEEGFHDTIFMVEYETQGEKTGGVVRVDMSQLFEQDCTLESDFEGWSPQDCLMGRNVQYHRRKPGSTCRILKDQVAKGKIIDICPCSENDFECDYGYKRAYYGGPCERDISVDVGRFFDACGDDGMLRMTLGYRKVEGNVCDPTKPGAIDHLPKLVPCTNRMLKRSFVVLTFALFLIVSLALLNMWWTFSTQKHVKFSQSFGNGSSTYTQSAKLRLQGLVASIRSKLFSSSSQYSYSKAVDGFRFDVPESAIDIDEFQFEDDDTAEAVEVDVDVNTISSYRDYNSKRE